MERNGSNQIGITTHTGIEEWEGDWCEPVINNIQKNWVYFSQLKDLSPNSYRISRWDDDLNIIEDILVGASDHDTPECSPDNTKLAYVRSFRPSQIFVSDLKGQMVQSLSPVSEDCIEPKWSPDSWKIIHTCYERIDTGGSNFIIVSSLHLMDGIDLDNDGIGDNRIKIDISAFENTGDTYKYSVPHWSPDGKYIAFNRDLSSNIGNETGTYHILEWDGSNILGIEDIDPNIIPAGSFISDWK